MSGGAAAVLLLVSGCAVQNNYLVPDDFAKYAESEGIKVTQSRVLDADIFRCTVARSYTIEEQELFVLKYDISAAPQRRTLERIKEHGCVYFQGIPLPAKIHGSFVFVLWEKNPAKRRILKAIEKFE